MSYHTIFRSYILIGSAMSALALAVPRSIAQTTYDVATLASACLNCHLATGSDASSASGSTLITPISGRSKDALLAQLRAFKSDTQPAGTTIMNRIAKGYSDDELIALSEYFSKQSAAPSTPSKGGEK